MILLTAPPDWTLHYERSGFTETGRYAEALAYVERLAKHAPRQARVVRYGTSPEGRPMVAILVSGEGALSLEALERAKRPVVVVQNGIHSGEIDGKDASLMVLRQILVEGSQRKLIDRVNLVVLPVFSVDAHERFGPYNRINQNGPREMGWRATANNLNLNRDYIKADAGEMKALLGLLNRIRFDALIDNHVNDGADYQFVMKLGIHRGASLPPAQGRIARALYQRVKMECDAAGFPTSPYFGMNDRTDPSKGLAFNESSPRYSTGYATARNRVSMLVETLVMEPYRRRVDATHAALVSALRYLGEHAEEVRAANRAADAAEERARPGQTEVLTTKSDGTREPFRFLGWEYSPRPNKAAGAPVARWDRTKPIAVDTWLEWADAVDQIVEVPAGYAVPAPWAEALERLALHRIRFTRLAQPVTDTFDTDVLESARFPSAPFEGRFQPAFAARRVREERTLPIGTAIIPANQVGRKLLAHLLEPSAPDSLAAWGFFNAVFERKEYFEDYAMAPVAERMLEEDPALRKEFEERLKDPAFARNPRARLGWLYDRSPWADARLNRHPVVRLSAEQLARLRR